MIVTLPFPPSVNSMFINVPGRGRAQSKDYKAWKIAAAWELKEQKAKPVTEPAEIRIDLDDKRRGDADNRTKAVLDLLVAQGILRGDSKKFVKRVSTGWEAVDGCRVSIITQ